MSSTPFPNRHPAAELTAHGDSSSAAVASTHFLATQAGRDIMRAGGNAVDAAIAANAVLGVVLPDTCGPGGDLFALIHQPGEPAPRALNASGRAGAGARSADVRASGLSEIPLRSAWTVTIPGCVDGWEALHAELGTVPMPQLLGAAVSAAREGFPVSPELADSLRRLQPVIGGQAAAQPLYPGGAAPGAGDIITRPDLGETLEAFAGSGRDAFYQGPVGAGITEATDGMVTPSDLSVFQAEWIEPLHLSVYGLDAWTIPPNSQGYITLAAAWIAERLGPTPDPADPAYHHALIEAYRAAAWDRDDVVADPKTAPVAAQALVAEDRLEGRRSRIRPDAVALWPASRDVPGGTMYLCTRDAAGLAVSLIQSNFHGIGSGLGAGATGVFLQNRGAGFNLIAGHPNELVPGRRPLHTLSPTLWTTGGRLRLVLGTRGGQHQPQLLLQFAAHHLMAGLELDAAMAVPRWTVDHWGRDENHVVTVEDAAAAAMVDGLRKRGHRTEPIEGWQAGWGPMAAISEEDGIVRAAADPRVSTAAAAVD